MRKSRYFILWVVLDVALAILIHWLLLEKSRGFAHTRAWRAKFTSDNGATTSASSSEGPRTSKWGKRDWGRDLI